MNGATTALQFVRAVAFGVASGGDISADGTQIILRREDLALMWDRCDGEPLDLALSRAGRSVPVVGPPTEPNGEAVALLPDGSGYVTISEGASPLLHFFPAQCPTAPRFTLEPSDQSAFADATDAGDFVARAVFGSATTGVSFNYDPVTRLFGGPSQLGVNGVLRAASGSDLGSPGSFLAPVISPVLTGRLVNGLLRIEFPAQAGRTYFLETLSDAGGQGWGAAGENMVATNNSPLHFERPRRFGRQFFRVVAE